jgi:predicted dinucleotide-binding enzyme
MNIVILGKGNMGAPLYDLVKKAGHDVTCFDSKTDPTVALKAADVAIIATKYEQAISLSGNETIATALTGKIVVDVTNPLASDFMSLTIGHTTSAAEEIARHLPGAHIVKAFNTVFASLLQERAAGRATDTPVYIAGDHEAAVQTVAQLAKGMGFKAVTAGPLSNARYLEPMAELMIQFGYSLGHGDKVGFVLKNEAEIAAAA